MFVGLHLKTEKRERKSKREGERKSEKKRMRCKSTAKRERDEKLLSSE